MLHTILAVAGGIVLGVIALLVLFNLLGVALLGVGQMLGWADDMFRPGFIRREFGYLQEACRNVGGFAMATLGVLALFSAAMALFIWTPIIVSHFR